MPICNMFTSDSWNSNTSLLVLLFKLYEVNIHYNVHMTLNNGKTYICVQYELQTVATNNNCQYHTAWSLSIYISSTLHSYIYLIHSHAAISGNPAVWRHLRISIRHMNCRRDNSRTCCSIKHIHHGKVNWKQGKGHGGHEPTTCFLHGHTRHLHKTDEKCLALNTSNHQLALSSR